MRKATIFIVAALLLMLGATPVYANGVPPLPHAFYGDVAINGSPAPIGTTVEARGTGVLTGIEANPITTTELGKYGSADPFGAKLIVQGDILDGAVITFYVNGVSTGQTTEWHSGEGTELDLSATISEEEGPGGGGGITPTTTTVTVTVFGSTSSFIINKTTGELQETFTATSADGNLTITIPEGTICLDKDGDPLGSLEAAVDESPPARPEAAHVIGPAYDFGPDGATFDPALTFVWSYDPGALPEDVAEEDLVIAYYDEDAGKWTELDSVVDTEDNTITASVSHFTTFAIIGAVTPPPEPAAFTPGSLSISPTEVDIGESVTIGISVANTGGQSGSYTVTLKINSVVEETREVTVAAGASETVTFATSEDKAGTYAVDVNGLTGSFTVKEAAVPPPPPSPVNWPVLGGIIGGVIVLGLLIFFLVRRRAA